MTSGLAASAAWRRAKLCDWGITVNSGGKGWEGKGVRYPFQWQARFSADVLRGKGNEPGRIVTGAESPPGLGSEEVAQ